MREPIRDELVTLIGRKVDQHFPGLPMAAVHAFMRDTADAILADLTPASMTDPEQASERAADADVTG